MGVMPVAEIWKPLPSAVQVMPVAEPGEFGSSSGATTGMLSGGAGHA